MVVLCGLLILSLTGCRAAPEAKVESVKIGGVYPLSGGYEVQGRQALRGAQFAVKEINDAGGVLGRPLELVVGDSRTTPEGALENVKRVVLENKAIAITGPQTSAEREAVIDFTTQNKIIYLYYTVYEGYCYNDYTIYFGADMNQWLMGYIEWLVKNKGKNLYFIGWDYVANTRIGAQMPAACSAAGGKYLGQELIPFTATDFSAALRKAQMLKPDVLFNGMYGSTAFLEAATALGLKNQMCIASPYDRTPDSGLSSEAARDSIWVMSWDETVVPLDTPMNQKFINGMRKEFGALSIGPNSATVYDSVRAWANAINKAGSLDPDKVIKAMEGSSIEGPAGVLTINPVTHHVDQPMRIFQSGGKGHEYEVTLVAYLGIQKAPTSRSGPEWHIHK